MNIYRIIMNGCMNMIFFLDCSFDIINFFMNLHNIFATVYFYMKCHKHPSWTIIVHH